MKTNIITFTIGLVQVFAVSMNTYFISHLNWMGLVLTGFFVSFIWAYNVGKIAISSHLIKFIYGLGAMCGSVIGTIVAKILT